MAAKSANSHARLATSKTETRATQSNNTEYRAYQKIVHVIKAPQTIRQEVRKNQSSAKCCYERELGLHIVKMTAL